MNEHWRNSVVNRFGNLITWTATYDRIVYVVDGVPVFSLDWDEAMDLIAGTAHQMKELKK